MRETTTNPKRRAILMAAVLAGLSSAQAHAADLFWDPNGGAAGTGGAGAWQSPGAWRDGSGTGAIVDWTDGNAAILPDTAGTIAVGNATTESVTNPLGTITIGTSVAASSLEFANTAGNYTIAGGTLTVPAITLRSGGTNSGVSTSQLIKSSLQGTVTVINGNSAAGAAGSTTLSLNYVDAAQNVSTLNIGGGGSFDKTNRVDIEAPTVGPDGDGQRRFTVPNLTAVNFTGNFGMLSGSLLQNIGEEIRLNAAITTPGTGEYALFGSPAGVRFHFQGSITGNGGVALVSAPSTSSRPNTNASAGAFVFNMPNPSYLGPTRIMMGAGGLLRSQNDNFLPTHNDLIFGGPGVSSVGGVNLNGMDLQIGSLTTETGVTTTGIVNNGGQALAEGRPDGANAVITINGSNDAAYANTTYAGTIGVAGGGNLDVIQINRPAGSTGSTTLTNGNSAYSLGTTISGGAIISKNTVNNFASSPVGVGAVTVSGTGAGAGQFGTFGGTGQVIGPVTQNDFSHLAPGGVGGVDVSNPLDLVGGLDLRAGSTVDFEFNGFGNDLVLASNLTIPDGSAADTVKLVVSDLGAGIHNGTFTLIDYGSLAAGFDYGKLQLIKGSGVAAGATLTLNPFDGDKVSVTVTGAAGVLAWKGNSSNVWDEGAGGTVNWEGPAPTKFFNNDVVTFDDTGSAHDITVQAAGVAPATVTVNNNADYSFSGGSIAAATLTKSGGATLTFNNAATFSGGVNVGAGTLAIGPAGSISGGAISISNGVLAVSANGNLGASVPSMTLSNSTLVANGNALVSKPITMNGLSNTIDTGGNTLELSGAFTGGAALTKTGSGTLKLSGASPAFTGGPIDVTAGTLALTFADANGFTGVGNGGGNAATTGTGATTGIIVRGGATLDVQNTRMGYLASGAQNTSTSNGINLTLKNNSTLSYSGESGLSVGGGGQGLKFQNLPSGATNINIVAAAGSRFATRNFVKQENLQLAANTTVHLKGDGIFQLASGSQGTATNNTATQYTGNWSVEMGPSGVFSLGPILNGNTGEIATALGYTPGFPTGPTRPVTVVSGTFAIGLDRAHAANSTIVSGALRSPVTLSGGNIASTGRQYGSLGTTADNPTSNTPVTARLSADITLTPGTTSKVLLYEPVPLGNYTGDGNPAATPQNVNPGGPRSLRFITENITPGATAAPVSSNFTWGDNSTLIADSRLDAPGGALRFERTAGTVSVGNNATLQITPGGTVLLQGSVDALSDAGGTRHVNVVNNSSGIAGFPFGFDVVATAGTKNVGNVSGTGGLAVEGGGTAKLIANHIRQSSAAINGNVQIRNAGPTGPASGTSNIGTYTLGAAAKFDLTNNKLITDNPAGTATAGVYNGVQGDVQRAYVAGQGTWAGNGLTTTEAKAIEGLTTIAVATADQIGVSTFGGQSVSPSSTIAFYTYGGDTNFDGMVSGDDYGTIDFSILVPGSDGYYNGDFNYDGVINGDDYGIIDFTIIAQGAPFSTSGGDAPAALSGVTAVPEPSACAFAILAAASMFGGRRRRRPN